MAAINHDLRADACFLHLFRGLFDRSCVVVHGLSATAQDEVAVTVAFGDEDRGLAVFGMAEKVMRLAGREDGLDGNLHVAGGSIFETDGAGPSRERPRGAPAPRLTGTLGPQRR